MTRTEEFNKSLEIQQSEFRINQYIAIHSTVSLDLLALYDVNAQITAIEDMIAQGADMRNVVRLLCLASIVLGGVKAKSLETIKREILQVGITYFSRSLNPDFRKHIDIWL